MPSLRLPSLAALAAATCLLVTLPPAVPARAQRPADACSPGRARAVLCALNAARQGQGAGPLRLDVRLGRSASRHAHDMVARHYFAHSSPTGVTFLRRVAATGWTRGRSSWRIGEDLAWGAGPTAAPAAIVDAWMHSPPHRLILLDPRYDVVGIGVADGTPAGAAVPGATFAADFGS